MQGKRRLDVTRMRQTTRLIAVELSAVAVHNKGCSPRFTSEKMARPQHGRPGGLPPVHRADCDERNDLLAVICHRKQARPRADRKQLAIVIHNRPPLVVPIQQWPV